MFNGELRASKVEVLEIQTMDGEVLENTIAYSIHDRTTEYIPGQITEVENFDTDRSVQHTRGIFFYLERRQATEYLSLGRDTDGNIIRLDFEECLSRLDERNQWPEDMEVIDDLL